MATPATQIARTAPGPVTLSDRFADVRRRSLELVANLSAEDACVQSMPDASPAKWHLAHVTWFFETFILEGVEQPFKPCNDAFRELYNSYYNGIGKQFSRPQRGMITRPSLDDVIAYRADVDARVLACMEDADNEIRDLIELGLHHEQQHQELLLMDIKHLLSLNPLRPAYTDTRKTSGNHHPTGWLAFEGGIADIGHRGDAFHFDNESPRHRHWLEPFEIGTTLVTNGEYLAFMEAGAYRDPLLWLADGWARISAEQWQAPLYWQCIDDEWYEFTLHGLAPLDRAAPVCHVSYFEADAYAQWANARLPTEAEWEHAASHQPIAAVAPGLHPIAAAPSPLANLYDAVWQWTRSAYLPYPGFAAAAGAVGEYNGKFMSGQMSLRGGACVTQSGHTRATYRNFFYPHQRWAFSGIRLARDGRSADAIAP